MAITDNISETIMIYSSKYEKLAEYLKGLDEEKINLTFSEIESILGEPLPDAAKNRAWWANSATNNHALNGWMDIGWQTANVDMDGQILDFIKVPVHRLEAPRFSNLDRAAPAPRRSRTNRSNLPQAELDRIVQRAGGVDRVREYMIVIERYLFGELTEMELGQELRRLYHRR